MSDGDALLAAILAHPDEDTPRLVYADWLDENGQPDRAEFIRLQCANARRDDEAAEERAFQLEERNRGKWLAGLPQFTDAQWEFRRGFPEILVVPGILLLERYEAFARVPWVRRLCVYNMHSSEVRDFVGQPWNPRWVELELQEHPMAGPFYSYDNDERGRAVVAVAGCAQARQLRRLQFSLFTLTHAAVRELAESPYLDQLQELRLEGDANAPGLAPLRERFGDRLVIDPV
jgi:uncharacterized protein (TIGR02996 family)